MVILEGHFLLNLKRRLLDVTAVAKLWEHLNIWSACLSAAIDRTGESTLGIMNFVTGKFRSPPTSRRRRMAMS